MSAPARVDGIENDGSRLNAIGPQVRKLRLQKRWTQDQLALKLQLSGWDASRDSIVRLEKQDRRVTDVELFVILGVLDVKFEELFPRAFRGRIKDFAPRFRAQLSRGQVPPVG
jgi:transcriptional regulator with XRE-family HTH domain